jgi:hypothetical protein
MFCRCIYNFKVQIFYRSPRVAANLFIYALNVRLSSQFGQINVPFISVYFFTYTPSSQTLPPPERRPGKPGNHCMAHG